MTDTGHWQIREGTVIDKNSFGFIYEIHCTVNNKRYIGKKQCVSKIKRKPLKGKKRKRVECVESDWKTYTSSSVELNKDIELYGKGKFTFTIIKVCGSKWELAYEEIKEQINKNVLLCDGYYNGIINVRIGVPPKMIIEAFKRQA